jgi:hypothetical protein
MLQPLNRLSMRLPLRLLLSLLPLLRLWRLLLLLLPLQQLLLLFHHFHLMLSPMASRFCASTASQK